MSAPTPNTETIAQAVESSALTTAQQLMPILLAGLSAGASAATPQGAMIAMAAEIIPELVKSFGANSGEIKQMLSTLAGQITISQSAIDAAATARGITDPTQTIPPVAA